MVEFVLDAVLRGDVSGQQQRAQCELHRDDDGPTGMHHEHGDDRDDRDDSDHDHLDAELMLAV